MPTQPTGQPRTIVITGGTGGLGYGCATSILSAPDGPWHVVLPSRDVGRGKDAVGKLAAGAAAGNTVEAMPMDLASLASVREFAAELTSRLKPGGLPPLYGLVCNAGVQAGTTLTKTADGFESTFGVNHLGHFLLVNELLPVLQPPARVVVVASGVHDPAQKARVPVPAWNNTHALARGELGPSAASDRPFTAGQRRYSTSKLANMYFTYSLARRLPAGVTVNAYDPGMILGTGLQREAAPPLRFVANRIMPLMKPLLHRVLTPYIYTAEESGAMLARLVTSPDLNGVTGKYFGAGRREAIHSSDESYDTARAEELWQDSLALTGASSIR